MWLYLLPKKKEIASGKKDFEFNRNLDTGVTFPVFVVGTIESTVTHRQTGQQSGMLVAGSVSKRKGLTTMVSNEVRLRLKCKGGTMPHMFLLRVVGVSVVLVALKACNPIDPIIEDAIGPPIVPNYDEPDFADRTCEVTTNDATRDPCMNVQPSPNAGVPK